MPEHAECRCAASHQIFSDGKKFREIENTYFLKIMVKYKNIHIDNHSKTNFKTKYEIVKKIVRKINSKMKYLQTITAS